MFTGQPSETNPQAALDQALAAFNNPPIEGKVRPNNYGLPDDVTIVDDGVDHPEEATEAPEEDGVQQNQETEATEETEEVEERESDEGDPAFVEAFKQHFGIEPKEAVEMVNSLVAFRDEMSLMRQWGVDPVEYDSRISAVKEFYNTLPEEGREQFNTVEGAIAIYDHLVKSNAYKPAKSTTKGKGSTGRLQKPTSTKPMLKKSDIIKMPKDEYNRRLPEITKAFREGRVIED